MRLGAANPHDVLTAVLIGMLVLLVAVTFRDYAISNDESVQHRYGELILRYYRSGFTDESLFALDNLYLYGGLFDVIAVLLSAILPFEAHHVRHAMCALIGVGGIAATALTARLVAGPRAGVLATALLAVFGLWYGGMFNHTKDIPFAAAMMAATCALLHAMRDLPRPQRRHVFLFGLFLGMALAQRAAGLLMLGYLAVALLIMMPSAGGRTARQRIGYTGAALIAFAPGLLLAYLIMVAFWPWASLELLNPIRAIFAFAQFSYEIRTLFAGQIYFMDAAPRWYVPAYALIKLPLIMLIGAALALFAFVPWVARHWGADATQRRKIGVLAFAALLPLLLQVVMEGPAFTGMRHFLFIVPPIAVIGAVGLDGALAALTAWNRIAAAIAGAAIVALLAADAATLVRLHPHQYLAYNALVGGLQGAAGRYETDYWANIIPEAVEDLQAYLDRAEDQDYWPGARPYTVAVCGDRMPFEKKMHAGMQWTADWDRADFFIAPTHMRCDDSLKGEVIDRIERLGVVIGVVKDLRPYRRSTIVSKP
jgi:hypothetical protein